MDPTAAGGPEGVTVVAVPLPAQGHLNQLLHFSLLLSSRGFAVHYACSATHNRQARDRLHGWPTAALRRITFHDLPLPTFSSPPPDPNPSAHFPTHLQPLFHASAHLNAPLAALLHSLSSTSRRLVVVHDPLMPFASRAAAALPNAESYRFICIPAFNELAFTLEFEGGRADHAPPDMKSLLLTSFDGCFSKDFIDFALTFDYGTPAEAGVLLNTSRAFDGEFIELLARERDFIGKPLFAVGPVNPVSAAPDRHECLEWLDAQPDASVVYVAFGSTVTLTDEQIDQLAEGLRRSGQRFLWVLKDADRGDIYADDDREPRRALLPGYEQVVGGAGKVVRGWAPQLEILAHRATGAFVSHCGWNSCMESLSTGVPLLAWPMHSDQPRNALMLTEYLKVGLAAREWARREETVPAEDVEKAVKKLMEGEEGKEVRKRAKELGEEIRRGIMDGGSSRADLDSFIAQISRKDGDLLGSPSISRSSRPDEEADEASCGFFFYCPPPKRLTVRPRSNDGAGPNVVPPKETRPEADSAPVVVPLRTGEVPSSLVVHLPEGAPPQPCPTREMPGENLNRLSDYPGGLGVPHKWSPILKFIQKQTDPSLFGQTSLSDLSQFVNVCQLQTLHASTVLADRAVESYGKVEEENEKLHKMWQEWEAEKKFMEDRTSQLLSDLERIREESKRLKMGLEAEEKKSSALLDEKMGLIAETSNLKEKLAVAQDEAVAEFRDSDAFNEEVSLKFYEGVDVVTEWLKKKDPALDLSTLEDDVTTYTAKRAEGHDFRFSVDAMLTSSEPVDEGREKVAENLNVIAD